MRKSEGAEALPPDEERCRRSDGRRWRCKRRAMEGITLCDIHHIQGRHRQLHRPVPLSLKLQRKSKKIIKTSKEKKTMIKKTELSRKKRCVSEALDAILRKMKLRKGDLELELIRDFLKWQVEKKKEKEMVESESLSENLVLPNAVLAISPSPKQGNSENNANNFASNIGLDVKLGLGMSSGLFNQRNFRSKNIEPVPTSTMQVVPFAENVKNMKIKKRKKCHWCRRSNFRRLIKCLSCRKQFFCMDCINDRQFEKQEVKVRCPVCRGTCSCRICTKNEPNHKEVYRDKRKVDKVFLLHYLVRSLLPVLKHINQDQITELEIEAKLTGKAYSDIQIQQVVSCNKKLCCCSNCKSLIVDYHRSCARCSYKLCLNCCGELSGASYLGEERSKGSNRRESWSSDDGLSSRTKQIGASKQNHGTMRRRSAMSLRNWSACADGSISCPPAEIGGCGDCHLDLKCLFPFSWTNKLEVAADDILGSYGFAETTDGSSCCSLCDGSNSTKDEDSLLQEKAKRVDSDDNFLYCPRTNNLHGHNHFQKHWANGHPVIIRNVLCQKRARSWDPVVLFCSYLEKKNYKYQDDKEVVRGTRCLDWCEVEIDKKQIFMGSLEGQTHANMHHQILKFKAWLSSHLFQEQFPAHYAEILRALPLQEYLNPLSGLLNIAAKVPDGSQKPDLGPYICISYGGPEELMRAEFLQKLCYDSYDMVNILAYATDVPISKEQFSKIKKLMKNYKAGDHRQSTSNSSDHKGKSSRHSEDTEESGLQDMVGEGLQIPHGIAKVPFCSINSLEDLKRLGEDGDVSDDSECDSEYDSEASVLYSGTIQRSEDSDDEYFLRDEIESSISDREKRAADSCGAEWDIFRRQDVPKLLEYLTKHANEFSFGTYYAKHVVHPILDQNYFLDAFHKLRLKEEFDVQPWTFLQHPGEAVVVPAGCPYQIRKLKSCVNVVLDFVSPESVTQCIHLTDEIRLLPERHKAREKVLEVRKMSIVGINGAIEDIKKLLQHKE